MPIPFTCPHCHTQTEVDEQYAGQTGACAVCGKSITIPTAAAPTPKPIVDVAPANSTGWRIVFAVLGILIFAGLIVGGFLFAWFVPMVTYNSPAGRTSECARNLTRIGAAMEAYRADHGTYPPAYVTDKDGTPMHSWRVLLLPYLDEHSLYAEYNMNEPWNGPNNARLAQRMPTVYGCPMDTAFDYGETSYLAITGPGTMFQGDQGAIPADVQDGPSRTMLVVEVANSSINWLAPRDLDLQSSSLRVNEAPSGLGSYHVQGGLHVLMVDGSVLHFTENVPAEHLRALATIDGREEVDPKLWTE